GQSPQVLTGPDVSTESEDKLEADPGFEVPDLSGVAPGARVTVLREALLEAVYFDTADLRLARNGGITLRYRRDRSPGSMDRGGQTEAPEGRAGPARPGRGKAGPCDAEGLPGIGPRRGGVGRRRGPPPRPALHHARCRGCLHRGCDEDADRTRPRRPPRRR